MNYLDKFAGKAKLEESTKASGVPAYNKANNTFIAECIILERLGGSHKLLEAFYAKIGPYAKNTEIINESTSNIDLYKVNDLSLSDNASLIACAKEADSAEFNQLQNALLLVQDAMDKIAVKYGEFAKERVADVAEEIENDGRITIALKEMEE